MKYCDFCDEAIEVMEDEFAYCDDCGCRFCEECGNVRLETCTVCSNLGAGI